MWRAELFSSFNAEQIMGMPAVAKHYWSAADVRELIDENRAWPRYELLDGELLVTPSPGSPHQIVVSELFRVLADYCDRQQLGRALMSPADIELRHESIMQPDVFIVPAGTFPPDVMPAWSHVKELLLAVEVLSPSTQHQDRVRKRDFYLANNVREYWIVDIDGRVVERWTPERRAPEVSRETLEWRPAGAGEPLRVALPAFFVERCGLPKRL